MSNKRSKQKNLFLKDKFPSLYAVNIVDNKVKTIGAASQDMEEGSALSTPLIVRISNGDMMFSAYPVLIGHFINDGIYSAEKAADKYLDGALSDRHDLDIYPGLVGTSNLFENKKENPFKGALIIGLGSAEELNAYQLSLSIEKAITEYLLHCSVNDGERDNPIGITSLFIGANYGGLSMENSSRAILAGIDRANQKASNAFLNPNLRIGTVEFLEIFEDKAISGFYSLQRLVTGNNDGMDLVLADRILHRVPGILQRIVTEESDTWWQRLSVRKVEEGNNHDESRLTFYSSTNKAREENQDSFTRMKEIEELIDDLSVKKNWSYEVAKTVFEMTIPNDFKGSIKRNSPILWILDADAAAIPWEMLATGAPGNKPLSICAEMLRQLSTSYYTQRNAVTDSDEMLVIGNPDLNKLPGFASLYGAESEAKDIIEIMSEIDSINVQPALIHVDATALRVALFSHKYKIIHFAGHGNFDINDSQQTGLVIGRDGKSNKPLIFNAAHFGQLPHIPELIFINACYSGKVDPEIESKSGYKHRLAANIGTQLIALGVKAVVVAGWDIADEAASMFAVEFYKKMALGYNFSQAVHSARVAIYNRYPDTNTWGAYQCYGQPYFSISAPLYIRPSVNTYSLPQEAKNDLINLLSGIDIAFRSESELLEELKNISQKIAISNISDLSVLEKEASAYLELDERETALGLLHRIFNSDAGDYNISTLEKYIDLRIKQLVSEILRIRNEPTYQKIHEQEKMKALGATLGQLKHLLQTDSNSQRQLIAGSAYKRMALITLGEQRIINLSICRDCYKQAYISSSMPYALQNWISIEIVLFYASQTRRGKTYLDKNKIGTFQQMRSLRAAFQRQINSALKALKQKISQHSFWEESAILDLRLAEYILQGDGYHKSGYKYQSGMLLLWKKSVSKNKKSRQLENLQILRELLKSYQGVELANDLLKIEQVLTY